MEGELTAYEIGKGVRFVLRCNHGDGPVYLSALKTSVKELDSEANLQIKLSPGLEGRIAVVKIKPTGLVDEKKPVIVFAKTPNSRRDALERVFGNYGLAKSLDGLCLKHSIIRNFEEEVVKTYKNESRA